MRQKGFAPVLIVLLIAVGIGIFFAGTYFANNFQVTEKNTETPLVPAATTKISNKNTFTYNTFSFSYPKDWQFLSLEKDTQFPLKSRLTFDEKVVAMQKSGISLIVTISKADQLEAGGIFGSDKEYAEFVSSRDKVTIDGNLFYLNKNHQAITDLEESHSGPALWGALSEYIPSKVTESGNVFRGYEQIIKRNGYMYNFIVVGQKEEATSSSIQSEIIQILESIKW